MHALLQMDRSTYHDRLCGIRSYTKPFFRCQKHERSLDSVTPSTILLYVRAIGLFFKM